MIGLDASIYIVTTAVLELCQTPEACTTYNERFYAVQHFRQHTNGGCLATVNMAAETDRTYSQCEFGDTACEIADLMAINREEESGQPLKSTEQISSYLYIVCKMLVR